MLRSWSHGPNAGWGSFLTSYADAMVQTNLWLERWLIGQPIVWQFMASSNRIRRVKGHGGYLTSTTPVLTWLMRPSHTAGTTDSVTCFEITVCGAHRNPTFCREFRYFSSNSISFLLAIWLWCCVLSCFEFLLTTLQFHGYKRRFNHYFIAATVYIPSSDKLQSARFPDASAARRF